ncbi:Fe(3+)-hydroxamate ABC transporter permease FhuB [Vibrio crassostreae]|uniref:Fe(3+)-hydroxamate ABC transporter permease FhuB n=1 Tax=Vibrio crassostreae TaxID=246167 RepID=UPI001048CB55|nr:Fe(3+)-hydroxamate ABC transporter permease FhuB [Vibrio crassostreae]TCO01897.1 iron complex transport system permease protein [Vibrio crassostreae]CAK2047662.1 ferric hydroxamate transport system permease protein [Vibrio crassostreae]CAK2084625.1 ferric hydroxamate transport system permease protein [Vibrio crassostreae]CAK2090224.1 ferric hydroxamate transport system permease protein [Vibrio crassostreae]CAK2868566.1 ferric hydroxamate transport system permease protein [Vibrio crassostrea
MKSSGLMMGAVLFFAALIHLWLGQSEFGPIGELFQQVSQISDIVTFNKMVDDSFELMALIYVNLPRLVMAILVGGTLGTIGSLFQQLTQNRMMSPLTLGTSSGAWLGLVILNVVAPMLVAQYSVWFALIGALLAMGLIVSIVGIKNMSGLPIVLAGMAVNLLLGAFATAIILLNDQYAQNLFVWGAGDLGQNGWEQVLWLMPKLLPIFAIFLLAPRVLTLLSIGTEGAAARGLNIGTTFFVLMAIGVWLVSVSITSVGVISFIGLIAPNIARHLGFLKAKSELIVSCVLGALLLCVTDSLAIFLAQWSLDMIPTGTATAVIGAPALIIIARKQMSAQDQLFFSMPKGPKSISPLAYFLLGAMIFGLLALSTLSQPSSDMGYFVVPDAFAWSIRWPRMLTAIFAGGGLAVAGVILQRLVYNPLASPDILGVSAGAVLALIFSSLFMGYSIHSLSPWIAFLGSAIALCLLLFLGKKHQFAPSILILTGISLTAVLEALVQFSLTRVGEGKYTLLAWLAGSTYRVEPESASIMAIVITACIGVALLLSRWVTLIATGRQFASARGLNINIAYVALLCIVAVLCSVVTTTMGPVAFVGLLAPHIAAMVGARLVREQIVLSFLIGAALMLFADWLGQVVVFPAQLAAGTLVSIIGGSYFILLLLKSRRT